MDGKAAGGSNYMYDINDAELNKLILDARASLDQSYRKTMYKACLDIIVDWAVEVPVYQRQNAVIFSTGKGNCIGHPVAPVIKISGNPMTVKSMRDNIDATCPASSIRGSPSIRPPISCRTSWWTCAGAP